MESAKTLKELREKLGMTQKEFGKKIFVEQSYVSKMEKGTKPISKEIKSRMEEELNIDKSVLSHLGSVTFESGSIQNNNTGIGVVGNVESYYSGNKDLLALINAQQNTLNNQQKILETQSRMMEQIITLLSNR